MLKAKEKAKAILQSFIDLDFPDIKSGGDLVEINVNTGRVNFHAIDYDVYKRYALLEIDEIIQTVGLIETKYVNDVELTVEFWQEVKIEIINYEPKRTGF